MIGATTSPKLKHQRCEASRRLSSISGRGLAAALSRLRETPAATVVHPVVALLCDRWIQVLRRTKVMLVGQAQLERCLRQVHPARACAESWTSQAFDLPRLGAIVAVNRRQRG